MQHREFLSAEEIESIIDEILTGTRVYEDRGLDRVFLFKQPDIKLRRKARLLYDRFYEEAHQAGLLTIDEMDYVLNQRGIYTDEDRNKIEELNKKINAQREVLKRTFRVPANRKRLLDIIDKLESERKLIESKRVDHLCHTCESKASERKMVFLVVSCIYDFYTEKLVWDSVKEFEDWGNLEAKTRIVIEFMNFVNGFDVSIIRQVARSGLWRIRYIMAKNASVDLFGGRPVYDFDPNQLSLMYWTEFYNSIYEMMPEDRPSDDIIEDDESLDAYMEEYLKERNRDIMAARGSKGISRGRRNAFSHDEVIVTRSNPLYQDIEYSPIPDHIKKRKDAVVDEFTDSQVKSKRRVGSTPDRI